MPGLRSLIRDSMLRSIYKDGADDGIVDESSRIEDVLICKLANLKIAGAGQCYKL